MIIFEVEAPFSRMYSMRVLNDTQNLSVKNVRYGI
jgi:hypothetical protein